jgi:hypothetical protein
MPESYVPVKNIREIINDLAEIEKSIDENFSDDDWL